MSPGGMQHDTSPMILPVGSVRLRLQASLLYLRYSKRRFLQFYPVFDRFHLKCFLHLALTHWGMRRGSVSLTTPTWRAGAGWAPTR